MKSRRRERLREHHQFGVEFFGASSFEADAEIIMLALSLLRRLGLDELTLHLNSIGCGKCRREYNKALFDYLKSHIDGMCKTCQDRLERNPMRILDCKEERCKEICRSASRTLDYLCDDCRAHFEGLKRCLDTCGVKYVVDPDIVRGLDYYTGSVFEIVSTASALRAPYAAEADTITSLKNSEGNPFPPSVSAWAWNAC